MKSMCKYNVESPNAAESDVIGADVGAVNMKMMPYTTLTRHAIHTWQPGGFCQKVQRRRDRIKEVQSI